MVSLPSVIWRENNSGIDLLDGQKNNQKNNPRMVIDWDHLNDMSGGNEVLIQSFLKLFCENAAAYIKALEDADIDGGEWCRVSHKLKGAAQAIGARQVAVQALKAEKAGTQPAHVRAAMTVALKASLADVSKLLK
jgi:HPt (histidine-containing phosphotransfer) domain-containing protein